MPYIISSKVKGESDPVVSTSYVPSPAQTQEDRDKSHYTSVDEYRIAEDAVTVQPAQTLNQQSQETEFEPPFSTWDPTR